MKTTSLVGLCATIICGMLAARSDAAFTLKLEGTPIDIKVFNSKTSLTTHFGKVNIRDDSVHVGEGSYEKCTTIFYNDKTKALSVVWPDSLAKANWHKIYLGDKAKKWFVKGSIKLGTTLADIERINGKQVVITGFSWDYSGTIVDYCGGKLDISQTRPIRIILRLLPKTFKGLSKKEENSVIGDKNIPSSDPVMQKLNPRVYQIILVKEDK